MQNQQQYHTRELLTARFQLPQQYDWKFRCDQRSPNRQPSIQRGRFQLNRLNGFSSMVSVAMHNLQSKRNKRFLGGFKIPLSLSVSFIITTWACVIPTILHGQIDTHTPLPESAGSADPNVASPQLKSNYFLAEAKFQEEAFFESQQLFQKLIDTFQKTGLSKHNETDLKSSNNDTQFISGAYYRLSQLSAKDYSIYSQGASGNTLPSIARDVSGTSNANRENLTTNSTMHKANLNMALYQLDLALKYSPKNRDYLYAKAQLLEKTNNWLGAAKIYKDLCSIDPHSWTFHEKAASAYFEYLPQVLNGNAQENSGKSKQRNPSNDAQSQVEVLQEFQIFSDTWEKHFSLSPSIIETKLYILWCQEILPNNSSEMVENPEKNNILLLRYQSMIPANISQWMQQNDFTNHTYNLKKIVHNPLSSISADFQSKGNTRVQIRQHGTYESNAQEIFQTAIREQNWLVAYQYADTLENTLPIFTAHDIVKGFQQLMINQPHTAVEICKNNAIETNPFIQELYLLLEAKATTQIAISNEKNEVDIAFAHASELSHALELWQKLYNQKVLTQLNDINDAKSIAILLNNQEWVHQFQQLASDLDPSHTKPNQK